MTKEGEPQRVDKTQTKPQENFYENPFFLIQVDYYDGNFIQNKYVGNPFFTEPTPEELSVWLSDMNESFQERLMRETLDNL